MGKKPFLPLLPGAGLLVLFVLCLCPVQPARAQATTPRFTHFTTANGLPHAIVNCLLQDRWGYLWLGTQRGLSRYDGYSFTNFHHQRSNPDSLANDTVQTLFEDHLGNLWVGTVSGLDRYDPASERFIHYPQVAESVRALAEDAQGNLWIGTAGSGLFRYDPAQQNFQVYIHDPADPNSLSDNHISALWFDSDGVLWIGSDYGGLNALDPRSGRVTKFTALPSPAPPLERVTALLPTPEGDLWVGTGTYHEPEQGGLARFNPRQGAFTFFYEAFREHHLTALLWDSEALWVGTQEGLYRYDPIYGRLDAYRHNALDPTSLSDDQVTALLQDRSGNLWIATDGGGVNLYPRTRLRFEYYAPRPGDPNSLAAPTVGAVLKDHQGFVWVGLHDNGLDRLDRRTGQVSHFRHNPADPYSLSHDHVTALYEDRRGDLWIGTHAGLDRLDRRTDRFEHFTWALESGSVKAIIEDGAGTLWIGTEEPGTLVRFAPQTYSFKRYAYNEGENGFPNTYGVRALLPANDGTLWIGTYNGLVRFDPQQEIFQQYRSDPANPQSLSHDFVWSLYQDSDGTLWVGTHAGLNRLDWPCGTAGGCEPAFTAYTTENGLPDDSIVALLGDEEGRLWLATMGGGLIVFEPSTATLRAYTENDGLQGRAFVIGAASRSADGELFFGGINGLNAFYPKRLESNRAPPPVVLTAFRVFDQERQFEGGLHQLQEIRLTHRENFFAFEFAALDFTDPSRNQYAYRLEGFDTDWIHSGTRRYASYTNLPPGRYVFRVRASNNDGVWNEEGLAVTVVIEPAFWQTWWFRLLVGLAVAGLASLYLGARLRYVAELRRSEERFRTLFENAPLGVCEADFGQDPPRMDHFNPTWQRLFAWSPERPPDLETILGAETIERCRTHLGQGTKLTLETTGRRCDGSTFPLRLSTAPIIGHGQERAILVVEDISAEVARRSEEEAIAEERRRIAREIHDGLAQDLAALRLQVRRWQSLVESDPLQAKAELDDLHRLLGEKIREVRRAIFALRPVALDEQGFWAALERFLNEFRDQNQLALSFQVQGERTRLPAALEPTLFRIIQEALHNVARHAQASAVWVELDLTEGVLLVVRDDGLGFDPTELPRLEREGHLGLRQMRERVEALGGHVEVSAAPGKGTTISVRL